MKATREFNALLLDCRIQAAYEDVSGRRQRASVEALLALLREFGVEVDEPGQAGEIFRQRQHDRSARGIEPVQVAWNGRVRPIILTLPTSLSAGALEYYIPAGDESIEGAVRIEELPLAPGRDVKSSEGFVTRRLSLPKKLPWGYHPLSINVSGRSLQSLIISSPMKAFTRDGETAAPRSTHRSNGKAAKRRPWGVFLPLYALRTKRDWGLGDFTDLGDLMEWVGRLGGSDVGTLPLLAAFLDEPLEVSPYRPASRLFWNELYIDVEGIPELLDHADLLERVKSDQFSRRIAALHDSDYVNYREVMRLKREVIQPLADRFFHERPSRFSELQKFVTSDADVFDYARFRATCERHRASWLGWPEERMKRGDLSDGDYDVAAANYYLYAQWIANQQLADLRQKGEAAGCNLYLDLPIGVDPGGYEVWRHQHLFATRTTVGSPPDPMFPKGQDWGLPPMIPDRIREDGYHLFRRVMETSCKYAGRLRIDHILGFHRLYCIPPGFGADQGAYVQYNAEELYAVAVLESHRNRCALVGENLGTVTRNVDRQMARHGIAGMWVAPYELEPGRRAGLSTPTNAQIAMLNTHDMPPLASWWNSADIADRIELQLVSPEDADRERKERRAATQQLKDWLRSVGAFTMGEDVNEMNGDVPLVALVRTLMASPARLALVNLEDLWLETRPQNIPSTSEERPNWRRKARYPLDEFQHMPEVLQALNCISYCNNPWVAGVEVAAANEPPEKLGSRCAPPQPPLK
jgi:4-alpha-glucanotransferase